MLLTYLNRIPKIFKGRDFFILPDIRIKTVTLGDRYASWTVNPFLLNENSIVYSFGVGDNISFDLALIEKFKCKIFLFDPTPRSIEWLESQNLPSNIRFFPYGLSNYDGIASFMPPENPKYISYTLINDEKDKKKLINLEVKKITTIMRELGHDKIDLVKMDIEGAEYGVIEDIILSKINVSQVLIEFHHRFPEIGIKKTKLSINQLRKAGYSLFHVSPSGEEYSFIKL